MNFIRTHFFSLVFIVLGYPCCTYGVVLSSERGVYFHPRSHPNQEDYKVLSLTRHSFKGVPFVNGQEISLPHDISLPNPFISWDDQLSEAGAHLIQISAINRCVQAGFNELKLGKWSKKWDEIRCDFLYQRTFLTGKIIKQQMKNQDVKLTAVIDKEEANSLYTYDGHNYDSVSYAMVPGTFPTVVPATPTNINPNILQEKTRIFLNWLNLAINKPPFNGELPPVFVNAEFNSFYTTNITIATDLAIMSAFPIPPLNKLFKNNTHYPFQSELVKSACNLLDYTVPNLYSTQYIVYNSIPIIQYLNEMDHSKKGKMIVTHDIRQLQLLKALDIESNSENIPFQSYVIIQARNQICIMYTAPKIGKNGTFHKSAFTTKLIWKGTLVEWNEKILNMMQYVDAHIPLYPVKQAWKLKP